MSIITYRRTYSSDLVCFVWVRANRQEGCPTVTNIKIYVRYRSSFYVRAWSPILEGFCKSDDMSRKIFAVFLHFGQCVVGKGLRFRLHHCSGAILYVLHRYPDQFLGCIRTQGFRRLGKVRSGMKRRMMISTMTNPDLSPDASWHWTTITLCRE